MSDAVAVSNDDIESYQNGTEIDKLFYKIYTSDSKSKLKKYLTKDVYDAIKDRKTGNSLGLDCCIRSGAENLGILYIYIIIYICVCLKYILCL